MLALLSGDNDSVEDDPGAAPADTKFVQTWPKDYGQTTCAEWNQQMTHNQQRVAAADMLASAWRADGKRSLPSDELIARFQAGISQGCEPMPSLNLAEAGGALYVIGRSTGEFSP